MDLQKIADMFNAQNQNERAAHQMTLGELILVLKSLPQDQLIEGLTDPHSYRGYYRDLAFERCIHGEKTVEETLKMAEGCLNCTFGGYKGGDYTMHKNTPIWIAVYGYAFGEKIMRLNECGKFETEREEFYA